MQKWPSLAGRFLLYCGIVRELLLLRLEHLTPNSNNRHLSLSDNLLFIGNIFEKPD